MNLVSLFFLSMMVFSSQDCLGSASELEREESGLVEAQSSEDEDPYGSLLNPVRPAANVSPGNKCSADGDRHFGVRCLRNCRQRLLKFCLKRLLKLFRMKWLFAPQ